MGEEKTTAERDIVFISKATPGDDEFALWLTSNWLRIAEAPDAIRFFEASGAAGRDAVQSVCDAAAFPVSLHGAGFFSFASLEDINDTFAGTGKFFSKHAIPLMEFVESGSAVLGVAKQDASNTVIAMFRNSPRCGRVFATLGWFIRTCQTIPMTTPAAPRRCS
ncbi:hypothetical protein [Mesorhizobium escarrei]|uniref:Uncharacterized protein n=1 Tax=Mesorhizobium escarrei TaxID=666018 RepID=A0ABM9EJA5_9HYPH|nr:hypothetical protein [Mesorhizobium escarrei]CAH2409471.1 hypothetical protein MES5069_880004 [Mesorhizobium escarrei]